MLDLRPHVTTVSEQGDKDAIIRPSWLSSPWLGGCRISPSHAAGGRGIPANDHPLELQTLGKTSHDQDT